MPLYYFHILDGTRRIADDEGMNLSGFEAAQHEARESAMDLLTEWMKTRVDGDPREIEITDAEGRVLERKTLRVYAGLDLLPFQNIPHRKDL